MLCEVLGARQRYLLILRFIHMVQLHCGWAIVQEGRRHRWRPAERRELSDFCEVIVNVLVNFRNRATAQIHQNIEAVEPIVRRRVRFLP